MRKLLSGNFSRLWRDKLFWAAVGVMAAFALLMLYNIYYEQADGIDTIFFGYAVAIGIGSAAYTSLYLGTEYSDGTIRNKLVVGHSRCAIYLSNLITSIAAAFLLCLAFLAVVCGLGIPLVGGFRESAELILWMLLGSAVMTAAFCSIFTMLSMLIQSKAVVAVVSLIGVFVFTLFCVYLLVSLEQPEEYPTYGMTESSEEITTVKNPDYVDGTKREVYTFLVDFLPTGQSLQYGTMTADHLWQMPLYSLSIIVVTTGCGLFFFRRKDIK